MKQNEYLLIDSGDGEKLERVGNFTLIRSSPGSVYPKSKPELWNQYDARYIKNETGSGSWSFVKKIPESFSVYFSGMQFKIKLTPFGHIGLFPEQEQNWDRIRILSKKKQNLEVLNLFAYSGASTIACLQSGMNVCHVDASKGMVEWARENAVLNQISDKPVRWIVEDVLKFVRREVKRGKSYQGFILDPPTFGRGSKGEVWKIEEDLPALLDELMILCNSSPDFVILSCHSQGFSPLTLERLVRSRIKSTGEFQSSELTISEAHKQIYPSGYCSFFSRS